MIFPHQQHIFDTSQLAEFIGCPLKLKAVNNALIVFQYNSISVKFRSQTPTSGLKLEIACEDFSSLVHVWASSLFPLPTVEHLYVIHGPYHPHDIEDIQWLELLRPFNSVENLYLSEELAEVTASALGDPVKLGVTEVLPTLRNLFLEEPEPSGPVQGAIRQALAARQLPSHPIAVSHWKVQGEW
jgi:hypothetical protein